MGLVGIKAEHVNFELVKYAIMHTPSLVLDCANYANPHLFYPYVDPEQFRGTYIIPVDAIYRFRDAVKSAGEQAQRINAKTIVVTTFDQLFTYHDKEENQEVIGHVWELLQRLSQKYDVVVPYDERCTEITRIYGFVKPPRSISEVIMGHTVWSGRVATDELLKELRAFGQALSPREQALYEEMLKEPLKHISKISYTSSMHLWAFLLLCILLEQEKRLPRVSSSESQRS